MKRLVALLMAAVLCLTFCGCKSKGNDESGTYSEWYEDVIIEGEDVIVDGEGGTTGGSGGKNNNKNNNKNNGSTGTGAGSGQITGKAESVEGLDFGGKTFTKTIIGAIPKGTTRRKAAFEKKYNCKIELVSLQWEQYNSQVATRMASGDPYDICGLQGYFFPEAVVQGLYEPLENYISEADLYDPKTGVGLDLNVSKVFDMNGHIYGASNHSGAYATMMQVLFYNKVMFEDAGLDDPLELWKKGEWTFDTFEKMAEEVQHEQSQGKYFIGRSFGDRPVITANGHQYTKTDANGKVLTNISDQKVVNALSWLKNFYSKHVDPNSGISDNPTEFYNGNLYMFAQVSSYGTYYMGSSIVKSAAFNKDFKNLGVVPYPYGPDNTSKMNPGEGAQAKAAGKGSKDPRIVIAWTKFERQFEDPMAHEDPYLYSKEIQDVIDSLFDNVNDAPVNYKTSTQTLGGIYGEALKAAKSGGDYGKIITDNLNTAQSIIDSSLGQK